jgi:hypothetical protein
VERWCAFYPQTEGRLTIAWGKDKGRWDIRSKEGGSPLAAVDSPYTVQEVLSKAVKYLAAAEDARLDMTGEKQGNGSNPTQTVYVSLTGLPLTFQIEWPFHKSTSGADFWVLHGDIRLEASDGLHARVAVNLSATVREVMPSLEPKDALVPMINALRKEVDNRQLEFVKSGKLVPLNFSSRHYDFKRNQWVFGKATDETIVTFLERKIYWQTKLVGGDVWLGDAAEAQYLQTSTDRLAELANQLAGRGLIKLERRYATAQPALMERAEEFESAARTALAELEKKHAFERG